MNEGAMRKHYPLVSGDMDRAESPEYRKLYASNSGGISCPQHGGMYLIGMLEASRQDSMFYPEAVVTPLDYWELMTDEEWADLSLALEDLGLKQPLLVCNGCRRAAGLDL